jgi:threonine dehydratase
MAGAALYFKCENLQETGSFKLRGATHAVLGLDPVAAARGVAAHSSGNHALALARAAGRLGIPCTVVMPRDAAAPKRAGVLRLGAELVACAPGQAAREAALRAVLARTGATEIHPHDHPAVVAGQGTAALELLEQTPEPLDALVVPVGGGGLLAGTVLAARLRASPRVFGAEPAAVDDAARSLAQGRRQPPPIGRSVADGLLTGLGALAWEVLRDGVEAILTVEEARILEAMLLLREHLGQMVEPSAAVALAAVLSHRWVFRGLRVGVILTGGNVECRPPGGGGSPGAWCGEIGS